MARWTTEQFIAEAKRKHGGKYDYSYTRYVNSEVKVDIICSVHGIFSQFPANHIKKGCGCRLCASTASRLTQEQFILKALEKHGDKFDYCRTVYKELESKIEVICNIHGAFYTRADNHIATMSGGCKCCGNILKTAGLVSGIEDFIRKATYTHGDKYDYSKSVYINSATPIDILCPIHGLFKQTPSSHLQGHGCPACKRENASRWTAESWSNAADNSNHFKQFTLYFTRLYQDEESFYKVGITYRDVHTRLQKIAPYKYEIINVITHEDSKIIYNLEKYLKRTFKPYKYQPLKSFAGSKQECFKFNTPELIESVVREMQIPNSSDIIPTSTK